MALGFPEETDHSGMDSATPTHPLEQATWLYSDVYIAVRVLGMRYPAYLRETTPDERHLYRLFLVLEQRKEVYAHQKHQETMELQRRMTTPPNFGEPR